MSVVIVVAHGKKREIGRDNQLLWHHKLDLLHFKQMTLGQFVIMGRRTFDSIGRPLPGRTICVVTRNPNWRVPGVMVATSLDKAMALGKAWAGEAAPSERRDLVIAGGADIYRQALPLCERLHVTEIDWSGEADAYFPEYKASEWKLVEERRLDEKAVVKTFHRR